MDVYSFILQRGSTLLALSIQSLSFDDNGITGLFSISHSEVVFVSFPVKPLAAQSLRFGGSLCHIFTDYSSLQRVVFLFTPCIVDLFFLSVKSFLQILKNISIYLFFPQHFLYFLPLPHGHGSFLPIFLSLNTVPDNFCSLYNFFCLSASRMSFHSSRP